MGTNVLSVKAIKRDWHLLDAKNQPLGRLSTNTAKILMGKNKPDFVPYLDSGDYVVVINAAEVAVSGKKETQKKYYRHSGYPGGLKTESLADLRQRKPEEIIKHAVKGMIPKTKLGRQMLQKLHVFAGSEHPFKNQLRTENTKDKGEKNG